MIRLVLIAALAMLGGCAVDGDEDMGESAAETQIASNPGFGTLGGIDEPLTPDQLERGRLDPGWRAAVGLDTTRVGDSAQSTETLDAVSAGAMNDYPVFLPLSGDVEGPSVLRIQVLLDRALFSPGVIDGRWGKNTEKAVYWLQKREGLQATGEVDTATYETLVRLAGNSAAVTRQATLTEGDVAGPFVTMPAEIYDARNMDCTCYESLPEKLGELFHVAPALLERLNPGVDLAGLVAGNRIEVPAVRDPNARGSAEVAEIVISVAGNYLHANDADGRLLYHFPTTLGSGYSPEEGTTYQVNSVSPDPWWNLQPRLLHVGDPTRPPVQIPPGPNNAVGNMWIDLSREHYGIHGTAEPQTIGYATSSGCVRLTNWDANFLGDKLSPGVPVRFEDIPPDRQEHPSHG